MEEDLELSLRLEVAGGRRHREPLPLRRLVLAASFVSVMSRAGAGAVVRVHLPLAA